MILAMLAGVLINLEPVCGALAAPSATAIPSTFFGMTLMNSENWPTVSTGALGKGTGVNWSYTEPQRGVFNWKNLDTWVAAASQRGVSFFFSNDLVPPWAAADPSTCVPTYAGSTVMGCTSSVANTKDWDDFVTAITTRYKGKLIYELWNEPYTKYFTGTVADMVTLTTHEYNVIRSIDPSAVILAPSGTSSYMDQYFSAGGPTGIDIISFHSYEAAP